MRRPRIARAPRRRRGSPPSPPRVSPQALRPAYRPRSLARLLPGPQHGWMPAPAHKLRASSASSLPHTGTPQTLTRAGRRACGRAGTHAHTHTHTYNFACDPAHRRPAAPAAFPHHSREGCDPRPPQNTTSPPQAVGSISPSPKASLKP